MTHRTTDRLAKAAASLDLTRVTLRQALEGTTDAFLADALRMALADVESVHRRIRNATEWTRRSKGA